MASNETTVHFPTSSPESLSPVHYAVNTIIACLAVLGNGMVITVMLLRRRVFSSFTNRLILHQSIIDCITGVVFFGQKVLRGPTTIVSVEDTFYDHFVCRVVASDLFLWLMNATSTYNLVIISLERFMATCYPVKHRNSFSKSKLKIAVVIPWVTGLLYASHLLFLFEARLGECRPIFMEPGVRAIFSSAVVVTEYFAPITVLIYTYTRILIVLTKKLVNPVNGQQNTMSKAKKNVLVTTLLIAIMFVVCWTPIEAQFIYSTASNTPGMLSILYAPFTALVACNMFVNPIIYCFKYEKFRSQLKYLVLKRFRRNRVWNEEVISTIDTAGVSHG